MEKCYLCHDTLTDTNKSEEHIIPNCIGGRLTSCDVLCEECNNKLGKTVDADFSKMFLPIASQLKIDKDRGDNPPVPGIMSLSNGKVIEVSYYDHKAIPSEPCHFYNDLDKTVTIYGHPKTIKNYENFVKKDMALRSKTEYEIENCDNIFGEMVFEFNLINDTFQIQLNKIATSFAIHNGVKARDIEHIDRENKTIKPNNCVPYYPLGTIAPIIEANRTLIDPYYPSHTLILFTYQLPNGAKELWCYIELFSTFQFYSRLNQCYKGEHIWKSYQQKLFSAKGLSVADVNCKPSDLHILCQQYNIECKGTIKDIQRAILNASNKQSYELSYCQTSNDLIDSIINGLALNETKDMARLLHAKMEYDAIASNGRPYNYLRISHFETVSSTLPDSSAHKCLEISTLKDPSINQYGKTKFAVLQEYIMKKHIEELKQG
ncbi:HNH endonuclease [Chitinispirillales bacterium ANBcel5]|uniref:HNH endonuclease n=1 Tax=Cellulosispirillum alkaliphilum TaxID=3039283 RepID=UPI002A4FF082|nr:HNH endonuclease [Chitinispirillales bacterium ANBcel5]